ncbi:1,2-phenylacetyl-CoA epoxidase, subunit A [Alicyclobacillus contaminans]|uniref:Phenylacetic acid catabolic protein n=1 Tax=Alicyclobacillus contaminans TaxID=392016 RepID=UPI0004213C40|nr:Phenylacetic acid catabolic protein [Alicyclobacillus contaminans]GMA51358.1 1,2-phenylacetyl-CoA epoxidase, subunit A [Alicyclobacillus contaminans]
MAVDARERLVEKIQRGFVVETIDDMTEEYLHALIQTLTITGDTELLSVPALLTVYKQAPTLNRKITALAIMQDELGHAHIAYILLQQLGVDVEELLYHRAAHRWKNPYAFDFGLDNFVELGAFNALYDRAGYTLLSDVGKNTSYGPWRRALVKVDKEELFHLRNGESILREAVRDPERRKEVENAFRWMFIMGLEFFGVSDQLKSRTTQLDLKLKGKTNDQLRQEWLSKVVPFCESIGIQVPAHFDEASQQYVLDFPFPCKFDVERREWRLNEPDTWDNVIRRFKARGPENEAFVARIQKGYHEYERLRRSS